MRYLGLGLAWATTIATILGVVYFYNSLWASTVPGAPLPGDEAKMLAAEVMKDAVNAAIVAVSILLPVAAGALVLAQQSQRSAAVGLLKMVLVILAISVVTGVYNFFRFPTVVQVYDLATDVPSVILMAVQLVTLVLAFLWMVVAGLLV